MTDLTTQLAIAPWLCLMGFFAALYIAWAARW